MLDGHKAHDVVRLPEAGESKRAILDTCTKAYSAEIQAQVWIDIAFRLHSGISDLSEINDIVIYTSRHTLRIIGSGSGDPQKYDSGANRETLVYWAKGRDLQWVLLHLINETARHAGHADAVRELLDGTTGE